jgi:hypothetical protein
MFLGARGIYISHLHSRSEKQGESRMSGANIEKSFQRSSVFVPVAIKVIQLCPRAAEKHK